MVDLLWVPVSQVLRARSWNSRARAGSFTASRVASSVAVSTPLRGWCAVVVMIPPGVGVVLGGPAVGVVQGLLPRAESGQQPRGTTVGRRRIEPVCRTSTPRVGAPFELSLLLPGQQGEHRRWMAHAVLLGASTKDSVAHHWAKRSSPNTAASWSVWEAWARRAACLRRSQVEVADDLGGQVLSGGDRGLAARRTTAGSAR